MLILFFQEVNSREIQGYLSIPQILIIHQHTSLSIPSCRIKADYTEQLSNLLLVLTLGYGDATGLETFAKGAACRAPESAKHTRVCLDSASDSGERKTTESGISCRMRRGGEVPCDFRGNDWRKIAELYLGIRLGARVLAQDSARS